MDTDLEIQRVDAASDSIDRLIESREASRERQRMWDESVERYNLRGAAEVRREWAAYHRHRGALFEDLAQHHREMLGRLVDGAAVR